MTPDCFACRSAIGFCRAKIAETPQRNFAQGVLVVTVTVLIDVLLWVSLAVNVRVVVPIGEKLPENGLAVPMPAKAGQKMRGNSQLPQRTNLGLAERLKHELKLGGKDEHTPGIFAYPRFRF